MAGQRRSAKPHTNGLRAVDLFAGCGGLTEGLKAAGFEVVAAVEVDELAARAYRANHPEVPHVYVKDIRKLTVASFMRKTGLKRGELDLLAGCPPCQGFSSMRTLNGSREVDDPRNSLLLDYLRFLKRLRPKAIMLENVPGLMKDPGFMSFLKTIRRLGYKGDPALLDAADYGVPQRRRRLVLLAAKDLAVPPAPKARKHRTVRAALRGLPKAGQCRDKAHHSSNRRTPKVAQLIEAIPKNGGSRSDLPASKQLACHQRCSGFKDVYGRMWWDRVSPTITTGCFNPSRGRFLHPEENRPITLREAALLQGFRRGYRFPDCANMTATASLIGNALPPPFAKAQARQIAETLKESKKHGHRSHSPREPHRGAVSGGNRPSPRSAVSGLRRVR